MSGHLDRTHAPRVDCLHAYQYSLLERYTLCLLKTSDPTRLREIKRAVRRGARLLDARSPGWERRVAGVYLDIGSYGHCMLKLVFGDYREALASLEVIDPTACGFNCPFFEAASYNEAWMAEIAIRLH